MLLTRLWPALLIACAPDAPTLDAAAGGDAWTFHKRLSGSAPAECASVEVRSPRGAAVAEVASDGSFTAIVPLDEGESEVRAVCIDERGRESASEPAIWDVRLADRPTAQVRVAALDTGVLLDANGSLPSPARGAPFASVEWTERPGNPAPLRLAGGATWPAAGAEITVQKPTEDGDYYVDVAVTDEAGVTDTAAAVFRVSYGEALPIDVAVDDPAWADSAVIYGVVPYFFPGGTFAGVRERLGAIAALGADVLWFTPVTGAPGDDFGYAVTDHFAVNEKLGTEEDFRALVAEAHGMGLKVMLDFVANHTSSRHAYYKGASRPDGPYYDLYDRGEGGEVEYYFTWDNLPNLDYDNPEVDAFMIEAFAYWVREYGVDGFRVDVAWGVRERDPAFWPAWRAELKRIDPDLLLLAEGTARDPYWFLHGFDAAYDWTWEPGEWAWEGVWDSAGSRGERLADALTGDGEGFPADARIFRFLENNDTGERFATRYGAAMVEPAAALVLTLPGLPLVYTGQEVGAEFEPYDEGPPIDWEAGDAAQTQLWTDLIRLRKDVPALHGREMSVLAAEGDAIAYLRPGPAPREGALVALNFSDQPAELAVPVAGDLAAMLGEGELQDLRGGSGIVGQSGEALTIELPAYGALVLAHPSL